MYYIVSYFKILKILIAVDFLLNIEFDPEREMYSRKKLLALSQIIIQIWWNEMSFTSSKNIISRDMKDLK